MTNSDDILTIEEALKHNERNPMWPAGLSVMSTNRQQSFIKDCRRLIQKSSLKINKSILNIFIFPGGFDEAYAVGCFRQKRKVDSIPYILKKLRFLLNKKGNITLMLVSNDFDVNDYCCEHNCHCLCTENTLLGKINLVWNYNIEQIIP